MQDINLATLNKLQREVHSQSENRANEIMAALDKLEASIFNDLKVDENCTYFPIEIFLSKHPTSKISHEDFFVEEREYEFTLSLFLEEPNFPCRSLGKHSRYSYMFYVRYTSNGEVQYRIEGLNNDEWIDHETQFSELILQSMVETLNKKLKSNQGVTSDKKIA